MSMVRVFGISQNPEIMYRHLLPGHIRGSYPLIFSEMYGDIKIGIHDMYHFFDIRPNRTEIMEPIVHASQRRELLYRLV